MITRRLAQCLLTLTFCLAFSGCASWFSSDERDPAVHLVRVEVVRAKLPDGVIPAYDGMRLVVE